jgi:DNA-binding NtrC family response regulator
LQDHQVRRVGAVLPRKVNLRVIAATNRNLRTMVQEGTFREDLYYRLALVEISLPRLEDRREDLPLLQRHFIEKFAVEYNRPIKGLTRRAQRLLSNYSWPGNIRELENVIGNACMMADGTFIDINDLPQRLRESQRSHPPNDEELFSLEEAQRRHIVRVLERVGGNKLKAAKILGVGRNTIYKALSGLKLEKANLSAQSVRFGPSAIWSR